MIINHSLTHASSHKADSTKWLLFARVEDSVRPTGHTAVIGLVSEPQLWCWTERPPKGGIPHIPAIITQPFIGSWMTYSLASQWIHACTHGQQPKLLGPEILNGSHTQIVLIQACNNQG